MDTPSSACAMVGCAVVFYGCLGFLVLYGLWNLIARPAW